MHQLLNLDVTRLFYLPPTMAFYPTVGDRIPILARLFRFRTRKIKYDFQINQL
ncbi:MAG: hypothetical protein V7L27_19625 [Nostoc sp.]|uniref:hypothetical protein n=1 Tax=Nostoc sp. TaxID=1180 RepID=UPI002FF7E04D